MTTAIYEEDIPVSDAVTRERVGQRLNDLLIGRYIEKYYWARGEWHIVFPRGHRVVLKPEQVDLWLSGFRAGLRAQAVSP